MTEVVSIDVRNTLNVLIHRSSDERSVAIWNGSGLETIVHALQRSDHVRPAKARITTAVST
jgi:hypothetical protein